MSLGPDDLVLCAGTLPQASFPERVAAAAEAGFAGVSVFVADYESARAEGWSDAELRALLADHGVAVAEVDPLLRWLPGLPEPADLPAEGVGFLRHGLDDFLRVADALGARSINAVAYAEPLPPRDAIAEAFARLCDRAAEHGLLVHLEALPWTGVADARAALAIAELAARPNGGLLLDTWHHYRGPLGDDALRALPGARVLGVQLSDAPAQPGPDPVAETLTRRLLPGEGDADLAAMLRALTAIGAPAPLGVEVFSEALARLPAKEAARRAGDAARAVRARARERGCGVSFRRIVRIGALAAALASAGCQSVRSWTQGCPGIYSGVRYYNDQLGWLPWDGKIFFTIDLPFTALVDTLAIPATAFADPEPPKTGFPRGCQWAGGR